MRTLHHITDADLNRLQLDLMPSVELYVVEEHLLWCEYCTNRAGENLRRLREKGRAELGHISTDELELFAAGGIDDAVAASRIEEHVRSCLQCADRLLAVQRFVNLVRCGRLSKSYAYGFR